MASAIEDYALIGDMGTAALIGKDGSMDWLCLPRFDSPALFARILGSSEHGRWLLAPDDPDASVERHYIEDTAVLETEWTTGHGRVRIVDFMPIADQRADVVRRVTGLEGQVRMRHEWVVRPGYGSIHPWVTRQDGALHAVAGPDRLVLRGPHLPHEEKAHHATTFDVSAGEQLDFTLTWSPSYREAPDQVEVDARLQHTVEESQGWLERGCRYEGPHRDLVARSLLTLRLLTHRETGGIVAAPTTSLPEDFGGERNWDYRFCWLRDAALTLIGLHRAGFGDEGKLWRDWLLRAVAGDPDEIQIMYGIDGRRDLWERELPHLPGYADSRPVRIGNAAVDQHQADVLGEVMVALHLVRSSVLSDPEAEIGSPAEVATAWPMLCRLVTGLEESWADADHGIWEIRGPKQHFTHSRVLSWAAFDRGVRAVEEHDLDGPVEGWRRARDEIREEIMTRGVDPRRGCFVQHYDTTEVDASLLMLPTLGFVAGDDPVMQRTIEAIEHDLMVEGQVLRYRTSSGVDGLRGHEGTFVACSFWLVSAYVAAGRQGDAWRLFDRLAGMANDLGLYAEELDPSTGAHIGNFPQALSHVALVNAALDLDRGPKQPRLG